MNCKGILSLVAALSLAASSASAQSIDFSTAPDGDNTIVTIGFTPAEPLSSLGINLTLETTADIIAAPELVAPNFAEELDGVPIVLPGVNPFTGASVTGVDFVEGVDSIFDANESTDLVDGFFAAIGSTDFGEGEFAFPEAAVTFTIAGTSADLFFDVEIAQGGEIAVTETGLESIAAAGFASDFNSDGNVDLLDLVILGDSFTITDGSAGLADGDANGDGNVDLLDLVVLGDEFGSTSSVAAATVVPEPASAALVALIGLGAVGATRRRV